MRQESEDQQKQALGAAIRARRKRLGLSRRDVERDTDISYPYLSEIEAGKKSPSNAMLQRIGEALQTSPSELMAAAEQAIAQPHPLAAQSLAPPPSPTTASPSEYIKARRTSSFFHEQASAPPSDPSEEDPLIELLRIAKALPRDELELLLEVARRFEGGY